MLYAAKPPLKLFIKNTLKLVSATVMAQLLPFLILPFLTRAMGSEYFGMYSLFFTSMIMLGTLSALRFDYAINAAKTEAHATLILNLCVIINILAFLLILFCIWFLVMMQYLSYIWFVFPFAVFMMSVNQSFYLYANYNGAFDKMSRSKIINAASGVLVQFYFVIVIGYKDGAFFGLFVGFFISTLYLYFAVPVKLKNLSLIKYAFIFKGYINYPKLVFPGTFINFLSGNLPIYVIGFLFGASQAGYYSLANRVAGVPTSLVGRSIGEVYRVKANEELNTKGNFKSIFIKVALASLVISILGFSILLFFSQPLFDFVFGKGWGESAYYVQLLIPCFILQFATAPISYSLMLSNWQKYEFYWQLFRLFLVSICILYAYLLSAEVTEYVILSSIALTLSFIFYFILCYKSSK